ncbi:hypothetical protein CDAR_215501 [Caerostris darwini]|uniref:Uncharacterized protein n=1 Tax=Caerostris darwini TaxID=1538125 RepID=A0AAV4VW00_9ARAC|nr:hypothetical protein CDAR_215501 [Caerostris darwini]
MVLSFKRRRSIFSSQKCSKEESMDKSVNGPQYSKEVFKNRGNSSAHHSRNKSSKRESFYRVPNLLRQKASAKLLTVPFFLLYPSCNRKIATQLYLQVTETHYPSSRVAYLPHMMGVARVSMENWIPDVIMLYECHPKKKG